ncbi:hypothetical protein RRG08_027187 [Elysia crispata]|uniref:Uncharacterized protein n=1 Tax=Elysia crispata TaxID=231223 RepID=A0AAE1A6T0_9GAST|nr:hypothetical protein RRG08_027187 [Elysia crispata]
MLLNHACFASISGPCRRSNAELKARCGHKLRSIRFEKKEVNATPLGLSFTPDWDSQKPPISALWDCQWATCGTVSKQPVGLSVSNLWDCQ